MENNEHLLKPATEEIKTWQQILEEVVKSKPVGTPCIDCRYIVEPQWNKSSSYWHYPPRCNPCEEKRELEIKQFQREYRQEHNLRNSGIVGIMYDMTFDTFTGGGAIYDFAKKYAEELSYDTYEQDWLYIFGRVGSGKTHLSCAIANYILHNSTSSVKIIKAIDLLFNARDYNTNENEAKVINDLNEYALLIIDDLGTEKPTEWAVQIIYKLVDDRLLRQDPLIVTSNLSLQELEERLGERIVSRLATMCNVIKMPDRNYRLEKKQNKT